MFCERRLLMWNLYRFLRWLRPLAVGPTGEKLAAQHLRRQGFRILDQNLRRRYGEIDLLAEAPDRLPLWA